MKMKVFGQFLSVVAVLGFSTLAYSAKYHRTAKKEITPKLAENAKAIMKDCGASVKIDVDWKSFNKTPEKDMRDVKTNVIKEAEGASKIAKEFCSDAESKALFKKNVKKIVIAVDQSNGDPKTEHKGTTFNITTSKGMNSGGFGMKNKMNEW